MQRLGVSHGEELLSRTRKMVARLSAFGGIPAKNAAQVLPVIAEVQRQGVTTLRGIAAELNARNFDAPRGGQWSAVQIRRVL
jgi:hypothetical protein